MPPRVLNSQSWFAKYQSFDDKNWIHIKLPLKDAAKFKPTKIVYPPYNSVLNKN